MTVTSTPSVERKVYTGAGDYTFSFEVFKDSDLVLYYTDTEGLVTTLSLGPSNDYTVSLVEGIDGGTCHLTYAPTDGTLEIRRELPVEQSTVWPNNNPFNAKLLETDLDRTIMLMQQLFALVAVGAGTTSWKGDWITSFAYILNDMVVDTITDNIYICIVDHTSGAVIADDLSNWHLVFDVENLTGLTTAATVAAATATASALVASSAANFEGEWTAGTYTQPSSVHSDGQYWNLLVASSTEAPGAGTDWVPITNGRIENDCINGTFDSWEYATSQTTNDHGSDNRWFNGNIGSTKIHSRESFTIGQILVTGNPEFYSSTVVTSVAGVGNHALKSQAILDVRKYSGKKVAISFYAKADAAKDIAIGANQDFGSGGSSVVNLTGQKVSLTSSWQKFTVFLDFPSISGKTVGTLSYSRVNFWFDAGGNYDTQTDTLGQQSGTFDLSEVEVYISDIAVPVRRPTSEETLDKGLSYYWQGRLPSSGSPFRYGVSGSSWYAAGEVSFPRRMVQVPSIGFVTTPTYTNASHGDFGAPDEDSLVHRVVVAVTGTYRAFNGIYYANAELLS
jgi:hypothetical protein